MKFIHLIPALVFLHFAAPSAHAQAVVEYTGLMSQLTATAPKVEKGVESTANVALAKLAQVEEVDFTKPSVPAVALQIVPKPSKQVFAIVSDDSEDRKPSSTTSNTASATTTAENKAQAEIKTSPPAHASAEAQP